MHTMRTSPCRYHFTRISCGMEMATREMAKKTLSGLILLLFAEKSISRREGVIHMIPYLDSENARMIVIVTTTTVTAPKSRSMRCDCC